MKKLLGVVAIALTMVASTFALDLSIGGRGLIGGNIGKVADIGTNKGEGLAAGGGAYVNLGLFGGLGAQAEVNFVSNQIVVLKDAANKTAGYSMTPCNIVDVPVLLWYNLLLGKLGIGAGIGVNFSAITQNVLEAAKVQENWKTGLAVGANVKFYFNDHFGLVVGANGVFDFFPTKVITEGGATQYLFDESDGKRKAVYGTLGAEFKLF